jgi:hypothetical protein
MIIERDDAGQIQLKCDKVRLSFSCRRADWKRSWAGLGWQTESYSERCGVGYSTLELTLHAHAQAQELLSTHHTVRLRVPLRLRLPLPTSANPPTLARTPSVELPP